MAVSYRPGRAITLARTGSTLFSVSLILGIVLMIGPWLGIALVGGGRSEVRFQLDPAQIRSDEGAAWIAPVRTRFALSFPLSALYEFPTDHGSNTLSSLRLFEDDRELGPPRAVHADIRNLGAGRFSHWGRDLRFSASDNSDPRSNGRAYAVRTPVVLSRSVIMVSMLLTVIGAGLVAASPAVRRPFGVWAARWIAPTGPPPDATPWSSVPLPRGARALLVASWIACAAVAVLIRAGDRDPYLLSTVPTAGYSDHRNALIGYAQITDGAPRHAENSQTWDHLAMFNGAIIAADMYANRPLYPFLMSCLAWALGATGAALAVNLVGWAIGAWAATRVGAELTRTPAAGVVAGLLACVGPGWWFHLGDYSAHLLSFTMSSVATLAILRSRVWAVRQPAEVHAAIGAVLVLANLAYNTGLFFTAAYALLAIRRNRWWHVLLACLAGVLVQRLWPPLLNLLSVGNFDYYAVERQLFRNALHDWPALLRDGRLFPIIVDRILDTLVAFLPALPLIVLGAIAPLLRGVRRAEGEARGAPETGAMVLMALSLLFPLAAVIVYSPTATARGYLVFGASAAVWAVAGLLFVRLRPGAWRGVGAGLLLLGLATQLLLDTRHAVGDARATKLFMWGMPQWTAEELARLREARPTEVRGLQGEPAPSLTGGDASLVECGGAEVGEAVPTLRAFKNGNQFGQMIVVRAVLALPLVAALHLVRLGGLWRPGRRVERAPPNWPRRLALASALLAALLFVPPFAARLQRGGHVMHRASMHDRPLPREVKEVVQTVTVDPRAVAMLEQALLGAGAEADGAGAAAGNDAPTPFTADVFTGFGWNQDEGQGVRVEIRAGGELLSSFDTEGLGRKRRPIDLAALVAALRRNPVLEVRATREGGISSVAAWQHAAAPGRTLSLDGAAMEATREWPMPILEIRVIHATHEYDPVLLLY